MTATIDSLISSKETLTSIEREYCARSLAGFAKRAWRVLEPSTPLKWGWALDAICEHLEAVTNGDIKRLLINVPPGCMKSMMTGVIWPAWEWGPRGMQHIRYLGAAHKEDLAIRDNLKSRRLIQSKWYQQLWPVVLTGDQNAKKKFENDRTGFREAMAFESMTGSRGDRVGLDDPLSVSGANSDAELRSAEITFTESLPTRVNNDDSAIIVIMQRLNERDTSGIILKRELGYTHLCLPMRFEPGRRCTTSIGFVDPRQHDGELLFPERFSEEAVSNLERTMGSYAAAGQLQQRPSPKGGGVIKVEKFVFHSALPPLESRGVYADTALKTGERNDYSVFQAWGKGKEGKIYLIDQIRGKWEAPELERMAIAFWSKHAAMEPATFGALRKMYVEDKASGTGLIQKIKSMGSIPVEGIDRVKDKYTRLLDVVGYIESGLVSLPADAPFTSDLVAECESFTPDGSHAHDDQVDPMIDAINGMLASNNKLKIWEALGG